MEKVFAGVENQDKFDVSKLSDANQQQQSTESKNDSEDYDGMYYTIAPFSLDYPNTL